MYLYLRESWPRRRSSCLTVLARRNRNCHFADITQLGEYSPYKRNVIGSSPIICTRRVAVQFDSESILGWVVQVKGLYMRRWLSGLRRAIANRQCGGSCTASSNLALRVMQCIVVGALSSLENCPSATERGFNSLTLRLPQKGWCGIKISTILIEAQAM